jgi:hypothetical protein
MDGLASEAAAEPNWKSVDVRFNKIARLGVDLMNQFGQ